jgi:hypothetical protein
MHGKEGVGICGRCSQTHSAASSCSTRTPFLVAVVLDSVYQVITVHFIYPLELLFTATLLPLVPYALLRGPFNRLARLFLTGTRPPTTETGSQG